MLPIVLKSCSRTAFAFLLFFLYCSPTAHTQKGDYQVTIPSIYQPPKEYKKVEVRTFYLKMRDGVELACDLLIPAKLPPGAKIPTILHITRYWRSVDLRWPFSAFAPPGCPSLNPLANSEDIVKAGYAVLSVDARGSGASFGSEIMPMGPDEVADGKELMDWIVAQPWSDQQIGTIGISYNGWAAQMLATTGHPALKAIIAINSPFDGYDDMAVPGGVINRGLIHEWSQILRNSDQGKIVSTQKFVKRIVKGPLTVPGRPLALDSAIVDHRANGYADVVLTSIVGRDDPIAALDNRTIDRFFPIGYRNRLARTDIPVFAISGWFDMANPHAAARIFHNYGGSQNKLMIGPWNHFLIRNVSPFAPSKTKFDHLSEVMKFFDHHLKGRDTGLDQEAPVHYYTFGKERWNSAATWPPVEIKAQGWFLGQNAELRAAPTPLNGKETLHVDTTLGTGDQTRWDLSFQNFSTYSGLDTLQDHWVTFTSQPMAQDMEITGHPAMRLYIGPTQPDAAIFVYLEDIAPDGTIRMITDGHIQVRHAHLTETPLYHDVTPTHTFQGKDVLVSPSHSPQKIEFDLLPCSWKMEKGHQLRLAISGSDRDHFKPVRHPADIDVFWGMKNESSLVLPIMPASTSE